MTGQSKDWGKIEERPEEAADPRGTARASGVGPSTKELLHLLRLMEGKASA